MNRRLALLPLLLPALAAAATIASAGHGQDAPAATPPAALPPAAAVANPEVPAFYAQIVEQVAPRVHVLRQAETQFAGVVGNITVIEQEDGLVLIDANSNVGTGRRAVALIRSISPKPVKTIVITHWHGDHFFGLPPILAAWPNAELIAHRDAVADMETRITNVPRAPSAEYDAQRTQALTEAYDGLITERAANAPTPRERAQWARLLTARALRLADAPGTYMVIPRRTFTDRLTLPDRVAPVELMFLGRANTPGDISAWLPRQRVLVAGDAVVEPAPFMFNVYPTEALGVFDRMRALRYRVLVPGHGMPQRDTALLDRVSALIREVQRQVAPLARENVAVDQIAGRTDFAAQRAIFSGGDPWLAYWFDQYTLTPLIEAVHTEARGAPLGPAPVTTP